MNKAFSKRDSQNYRDTAWEHEIGPLPEEDFCHRAHLNGVYCEVNTCVQQCVDKDVELCYQHNLHYRWWLTRLGLISFGLTSCSNFLLTKIGCMVMAILLLRSRDCLRAALAAIWSLKPKRTILIVLPSSVLFLASAAMFWINILIVAYVRLIE